MKKHIRTVCGLLLALIITACPLLGCYAFTQSTSGERTGHDIAVVFDNSPAMYADTDAWSYAKYSLEVMASMLDYEAGDTLTIYPLWYATTSSDVDQTKFTDGQPLEVGPITISSFSDSTVETLNFFYTPGTDGTGTPFEDVEDIFKTFKKSEADEKWLVFMMASDFTKEKRTDTEEKAFTADETYNKIIGYKKQYINTLKTNVRIEYVEIGKKITNSLMERSDGKDFNVTQVSKAENLTDTMIEVCKRMTNLSELPTSNIEKEALSLPVSASQLYLYMPTKSSKFTSLTGSKELEPAMDSKDFRFSTAKYSHGKYLSGSEKATLGSSPKGRTYRFSDVKAGTYTFIYSGSPRVFYKPDIEVEVKFATNQELTTFLSPDAGEECKNIECGDYYVTYDIVDRQTGQSVTDNEMMNFTDIEATYCKVTNGENGKSQTLDKNGTKLSIKKGDTYLFDISASYLNGCTVSTSGKEADYTFVGADKTEFGISIEPTEKEYYRALVKSWKPIKINITMNGQPASASVVEKCSVECQCAEGMYNSWTVDTENSCIYLYIGKNNSGDFLAPEEGDYDIGFTVKYTEIDYVKGGSAVYSVRVMPTWLIYVLIGLAVVIAGVLFRLFAWYPLRRFIKKAKKKSADKKAEKNKGVFKVDSKVKVTKNK